MTNKVLVTGCVALLALVAGLFAADKPKTIKEVMANHKKDQLRAQITAELKEAEPDWAALEPKTKEYAAVAAALAAFEPPKGDKEAFQDVAKAFANGIKQVDQAVQKKDAKTASAALARSGMLCAKCHSAHKK
jgi:hypothetical protein